MKRGTRRRIRRFTIVSRREKTPHDLTDGNLFDFRSVAERVERMQKHAAPVREGPWIVGMGHDAKFLQEGRVPPAAELDQIPDGVPVMIVESSGHLGSGNTKLSELAGINAEIPDPDGAVLPGAATAGACSGPSRRRRGQRPVSRLSAPGRGRAPRKSASRRVSGSWMPLGSSARAGPALATGAASALLPCRARRGILAPSCHGMDAKDFP